MQISRLVRVSAIVSALSIGSCLLVAAPAGAAAPVCQSAGSTGLTAAVIATSNQTITGTIDATGCGVGVYIGPGITGVTVDNATISGANDHGILVQDASNDTIENSLVTGNGLNPSTCPSPPTPPTGPCISEDKGIELVGTSHVTVEDNVVTKNMADGGIGVADDGPIDPGAPQPGTLHPGYHNLIKGNVISGNPTGCGIVVAAYNPGAGVSNNVVEGNDVTGNVAGIVVAADAPHTLAINNDVFQNVASGNFIPGVIVHSNAPGDVVVGTDVEGNVLSGNGPDPHAAGGKGPAGPAGIVVIAEPLPPGAPASLPKAIVRDTTVKGNTYAGETVNLFIFGSIATSVLP